MELAIPFILFNEARVKALLAKNPLPTITEGENASESKVSLRARRERERDEQCFDKKNVKMQRGGRESEQNYSS
jgi:hypothetical protein